jgi:PAS domain S-box-containing protein
MSQTQSDTAHSLSRVWGHDEDLFRSLIEGLPMGIYTCDPEGRVTYFNPKAAQLWGRNPAIGDVCPVMKPLSLGGGPGELEFLIDRPDGSKISAFGAVSDLLGSDGARVGSLMAFHEVAQAERAEALEALQSRENRYRRIFESTGAGILVLRDGVYTEVNPAACSMLGRSPEEIIGREPSEFVPPERLDQLDEVREEFRRDGFYRGEIALTRPDGLWAWLYIDAALIPGSDEMLAVITDLSEQKAIEARAKESDDLLRLTADALPALISYVDKDLTYRFVNRAYETWFGLRQEDVVGMTVEELVGAAAFDSVRTHLDRVFAGETAEFETTLPYVRTGPKYVRVTYSPRLGPGGEVAGFFALVLDLSSKKDSEDALRRSEEEFRAIFEHASSGKVKAEPDTGRILMVNQRLCEITGYSREELMSKSFLDITHPDDLESEIERLRMLAQGKSDIWQLEKRYVRKDGSICWVLVSGRLIRDSEGEALNTIATVTDISEFKATQKALREAEERGQAAMNAGRIGTWYWDILGQHVDWSDNVYEFHGVTREEFDGKVESFRRLIHPEDLATVGEAVRKALEEDAEYKIDFRVLQPSGQVRWLSTEAKVLRDSSGAPEAMLGATMDITDRKLTEQQLRDAMEQFRLLAEASPSFILMSNPEGRLTFMSPRWEEFTGLSLESIDQMKQVVHPDDWERVFQTWQRAQDEVMPYSTELRIRGKADSEYRWFMSQGVPHKDSEGHLVGWVGVTTDIHDRKTEEQRLETLVKDRTAALKAANEEMQLFTYSVSHDLRAPLRAIVSTSRMLQEDYATVLPKAGLEMIERQSAAANKLALLIDDLLRLSRLGRQELDKKVLDVTEIAKSLAEELNRADSVSFEVQPGMMAKGDLHLVRFLLQNLMENAQKFSPEGGKVEVGFSDGVFSVRDEGIGLDMQYANKIFLPFERLHRDVDFPGTGIGLASVKQIAERHGGQVWVESEVGKGATFYFTLGR